MGPVTTTDSLEEELGHRFADPGLLELALTHRSWSAEHPGEESNERLEFLGDAVLGLVVARHLYVTHPELAEGEMAKIRAAVVSAEALAEVASGLGLGTHLRLGRGEQRSGGAAKTSILADAMEAVIAAVYLDAGLEAAARVVLARLGDRIEAGSVTPGSEDYKTRLQELAAAEGLPAPRYETADSGPDHRKTFRATVRVGRVLTGSGEGGSKKEAEQAAARQAWESHASGETHH
ncbi:MAG: ribonuclease III [Actinomyces sp.]|nr:MAG: ribonuclease III [Actinomyces sp.]